MPSVDFQLRSLKANDPFSARLRFLIADKQVVLEAKTELYVFTPEEVLDKPLVNGKKFWMDNRKKKKLDLEKQTRIVRILNDQENLRSFILKECEDEGYSEDNIPTKQWLQSKIKKYYDNQRRLKIEENQEKESLSIQYYYDAYLRYKKKSIKEGTIKMFTNGKEIFKKFEEYQSLKKGYDVSLKVSDVDPEFQYEFEEYLEKELLYAKSTIARELNLIKIICNYAQKKGVQLHKNYGLVEIPIDKKENDIVYLSFPEIQQIKNSKDIPEEYENARQWLFLSCFLGQRISDFMRFSKSMIRKEGEDYFVDFVQEKTNKKIALLLHSEVVDYLLNNNMEFPKPIEESLYNKQLKEVGKYAKINQKVKGSVVTKIEGQRKGRRKKDGIFEKWQLISSHIGRRSYCTNFYSKIPLSLLLDVSGHSEESTLLNYIGKKDDSNAKQMKRYYDDIDINEA